MKKTDRALHDGRPLFIVNAILGGRNTPGFRPYQPIRFDCLAPIILARGSAVSYPHCYFPLPGRSLIPRALNLIRVKWWPGLPSRTIEQRLFDWVCLRASRRLGWRPCVVHLWDALPKTAAFWHGQGVPLLLDLQMAHPSCYLPLISAGKVDPNVIGSLADPALDRCLTLVDRLICPSHFVQNSLPVLTRNRSQIIPFGADPITSSSSRLRQNSSARLRVLFAGNVNLRKGIPFLIEAWRQLSPEWHDRAELVLCGRIFGEMSGLLGTAPANIKAVGFQKDMTPWFKGADLFVLPSLMEGSAKSVYEAMAHGLAILVSSHTGAVITHGVDGWVVPPADSISLTQALEHILSDEGLRRRLGKAAQASANHYTWATYATAVKGLYQDISSNTNPTRLADTYREHHLSRPLSWHLHQALTRTQIRLKSIGRRIGGTKANWLRFPFYHHVFTDERRGFIRHLTEMRGYGEFITLDQAVGLLETGDFYEGRYFCLTFDDGFRNVLTHALPILAEQQIPATVFVISDFVLEDTNGWQTKHDQFFSGRKPAAFLTWNDCHTLKNAGIAIESHSASHRRLIDLSADEVSQELITSKMQIEDRLKYSCQHFCCPWGKPGRDFKEDRDPQLALQAGYRSFLTTKWGDVKSGDSPFAIKRVGLVARYGLAQLRYFLSL